VLYASPNTAEKMHYRKWKIAKILEYAWMHDEKLKEYNNTTYRCDYLNAVETGKIDKDDILVQFSLDSAQL
jgi:hypothetical protein